MKIQVKFTMEDLREYKAEYYTSDLIDFADRLTHERKIFPFIVGYVIEVIEDKEV